MSFFHRLTVCAKCLVGEFIPVFRPSINRWNFGQVLSFRGDQTDNKFELSFGIPTSGREWVELASKPFEAYVLSHHRTIAIILGTSRQQSHESRGAVKSAMESSKRTITSAFRSKRHVHDEPQPISPPRKTALFTINFDCQRTPSETSIIRAVPFDSPVHCAAASISGHATPIIGNGLNAKTHRRSASPSCLSRRWSTEVSDGRHSLWHCRFCAFSTRHYSND